MSLFNKSHCKHRHPSHVLSRRAVNKLKHDISRRMAEQDYSCVFKPERKVQKEGAMQFRYKGTDRSGHVVCEREMQGGTPKGLYRTLETDLQKYPTAICFDIQIARPDPEVVEIKKKMYDVLRKGHINRDTFDETVAALFNELDIKLKGKDNA